LKLSRFGEAPLSRGDRVAAQPEPDVVVLQRLI